MKQLLAVLSLLVVTSSAPAAETNCFAPFLTDTPPKIVEELSKEVKDGVEVTRMKFLNRVVPESGREVLIYAILARPVTPGKHPGMLVCHDGGGYADMVASQAVGWAKRGYVAICQDQPGICNRAKASSSGPCVEKGASGFRILTKPSDSALFDGVAAALNSLALLRSQPDVDTSHIGVWGGSWGGYMTTMVCGLAGNRVHAAFSVYGCGFYDVSSTWRYAVERLSPARQKIWVENLDAGRRAHGITAAYFHTAAANDWFFWPGAVMRTLAEIPGEKNYVFSPNDSHCIRQPGGTHGPPRINHRFNRTHMEILWLDYYLKREGKPFPKAKAVGAPKREGNAVRVEFQVNAPEPITKATLWRAAGELPWRMKWWESTPAKEIGNGRYSGLLPIEEPGQPVHWIGIVTDKRNVSVSTLVQTLEPKPLGFVADGHPLATFREDFEDVSGHRRWRKKYADRRPGRYRIRTEAAHAGKYGVEIEPGGFSLACWGLRAAALERAKVTRIRFWVRAVDKPCPLPIVGVQAEIADGRRYRWQWKNAPKEPIGTQWQAVEVPLADLEPVGKPPLPMLSPKLGQLRFATTKQTHVYIDDVEALR